MMVYMETLVLCSEAFLLWIQLGWFWVENFQNVFYKHDIMNIIVCFCDLHVAP